MAFLRQWLLILCLLLAGSGALEAATRESRAYAAALADAQDRMWSRAELEFGQFAKRFPKSTNAPMAILMQAQARFQQGKYTEAGQLLSDTNYLAGAQTAGIGDQYARWMGESQFASGQYAAAAATLIQAAKDYPKSSAALTMTVSAAAAYEKLGQWSQLDGLLEATNGVFQKAWQMDADNQQVAAGRLLLARSKFQQANYPAALALLNALNPDTLTPDQEGNRAEQLYGVMVVTGNDEGALAATTNLMTMKDSSLRANGVAEHAELLERKGRLKEAAAAWSGNLAADVPPDRQREAILKIADLAAAQNDYTNAAAALDNYLAKFPNSPLVEMAVLTAGEMHLKNFAATGATNLAALGPAQARFEQVLAWSTNGPLAGKAYLDRGWCEWLAGNYAASATDFRLATVKPQPATDLAVATFKLGDALFAQGDYAGARESYRQTLANYSNVPEVMKALEQRAFYQILRASLELKDRLAAETALGGLLEKFPTGEDTAPGLLLAGEGFSDFSSPAAARETLQKFEAQFADSSLKPDVEFAVARTYENEQNWTEAVAKHEAWLKNFPGNALLPRVQFALGRANFQAGDESAAFEVFTNFVASFPTNELAPLAQWWVAEHYFRAGAFVPAETNYEAVFQNQSPVWQTNLLVYPARMMAGRSAMGRQGYLDAVGYFEALLNLTNCPPTLGVEARFAYGAALINLDSSDTNNPLANLQKATNMFSQIIALYPTNQYGARAWGELGDCDLQLGDLDGATNAYAQVFNSDAANVSIRSAAQVGFGLALEKKARAVSGADQTALQQLALDNYLDVFRKSNLNGEEVADVFWVKKAGLQAAGVAEAMGDGNTAATLYGDLKHDLPQLAEVLDKKIAAAKALNPLKKN